MFAIAAAIIGGGLTAIPSYIAAQDQITAEDARSTNEFLREQRQSAYAEFITYASSEAGRLKTVEQEQRSGWTFAGIPAEFDNALNVVLLVGSKGSAEAAHAVRESIRGYAYVLEQDADGATKEDTWYQMDSAIAEFTAVAREDLGAGWTA